jgi:hypothetical protein
MELKKERKRKEKVLRKKRKELQKSLMKKGWIFLERRKTFQLEILFLRESIFSLPFHPNPSSKLFGKVS